MHTIRETFFLNKHTSMLMLAPPTTNRLVVTHIKKPLDKIIKAYFPLLKVNNISGNKNILKTIEIKQ
jgi:hypothetical protein